MNQQKIESLLRKIQTILTDSAELSKLEKDLVKDYLRTLYDIVDSDDSAEEFSAPSEIANINPIAGDMPSLQHLSQITVTAPENPIVEKSEPTPLNSPLVEAQASTEAESIEQKIPTEEMRSKAEPETIKVTKKVAEFEAPTIPKPESKKTWEDAEMASVKEQSVSEYSAKESPIEVRPNGKSESKERQHVQTRVEREVPEVFRMEERISSKYNVLFQQASTNELSDRLSRSPIDNLQRALSINDRLLTVNQLFNGNHEAFNETIDILNSKYSFGEAKSYLVRYVIDKYEWLDEEKTDQARDFIKLVERRFL